ncbi:hypothetical protein Aperf_G00000008928 [Anoplocephala perfoliata]
MHQQTVGSAEGAQLHSDVVRMMLDEGCSGSITTAVRVRPFSQKEVGIDGNKKAVDCPSPGKILCLKTGSPALSFSVDHVFDDMFQVDLNKSQKEVYETLAVPLLGKALLGYNACLFAYGVTSSGKTYSMYGTPSNPGIVPRIVEDLFNCIRIKKGNTASISVKFSYCEIYNEKIYDLLQDKNPAPKLRVREDPLEGPCVQDLVQPAVHSPEEVFDWLRIGDTRRRTAATEWNTHSSRSHTIASFHFTRRELASFSKKATVENVITSKLNLVDLAGSERPASNSNVGGRLAEACQINRSLFTLGRVIYQLSGDLPQGPVTPAATPLSSKRKQNSYVSYRDSLLTWMLKDSLGGNSVTTMLATVSPSSLRIEDTISTLQHVIRAQRIVNQAKVNEDPSGVIIRELKAEVERLQRCRKEASAPNSPLFGQIKTLENLLKTREEEVASLTKELTDRTLDYERLRAEVELRSCDVLSQPLFGVYVDPEALSETPIKCPRSCDERDSGAYSDISRPLPEGSEKSDSAVQTDSPDKVAPGEADSFYNTVLSESITVADFVDLAGIEASTNTDELFKLVPLAEYERILSDLQKFEAYRGVKKANASVDVYESNLGLCVLPTEQLSALKDIIKRKFGAIQVDTDINRSIASLESELRVLYGVNKCAIGTSSDDLGYHIVSGAEFKRLMEDLNNAHQQIEVLNEQMRLYKNAEKCDAATSSLDLDYETFPKTVSEGIIGEGKKLRDRIVAIETKKYTESAAQTNEESEILLKSESVALEGEIQTLKLKLEAFTNIEKREIGTSSADLGCKVIDKDVFGQITDEANDMRDQPGALDAKTYVDSMTLTNDSVEVISRFELTTLQERNHHLDSLVRAMEERLQLLTSRVRTLGEAVKLEASASYIDGDCNYLTISEVDQIINYLNRIRDRLAKFEGRMFADASTETNDYELGLILIPTDFLNGLYQRQCQLRDQLTSLKSKSESDAGISMELGINHESGFDFDAMLSHSDELKSGVEMYGGGAENVEKTMIVEEQSVHRICKEPTKESLSELPRPTDSASISNSLPELQTTRFTRTMPRRMDEFIKERVEFYENIQARVNTTQTLNVTASSKGLKRTRLGPIFDKENVSRNRDHKSSQTCTGRMRSGKLMDNVGLLQYRKSLQTWNLEPSERENKQMTIDFKNLAEMLMKLIQACRKTPSMQVVSILDDIKKTLNQVSADIQGDLGPASVPARNS